MKRSVLEITYFMEQSTHVFAADGFVDLGFSLNFMPVVVLSPGQWLCSLSKDAELGPAFVSLGKHVVGGSTTPVLSGCFVPPC